MSELLNEIDETARKNERVILQSLSRLGQSHVAKLIDTSESTVSRMKDGEIKKICNFLSACGS